MKIDDFARPICRFSSATAWSPNTRAGRVARRIWAIAMRDKYGANEAQPEAQVPFADLRPLAARPGDRVQRHPHHPAGADLDLRQTTNSLHTNAYDEAITTPTEESVRRAMAIQLVINKEWVWERTRIRTRARSSSRP